MAEVDLRAEPCVQAEVPLPGRQRRPIDGCVPAIARFCDCKVWLARDEEPAALRVLRLRAGHRHGGLPLRGDRPRHPPGGAGLPGGAPGPAGHSPCGRPPPASPTAWPAAWPSGWRRCTRPGRPGWRRSARPARRWSSSSTAWWRRPSARRPCGWWRRGVPASAWTAPTGTALPPASGSTCSARWAAAAQGPAGGMSGRDRQRARVYAWEDRVVAPHAPDLIPFAAAQAMVDAIWAEMGLRWPPRVERLPPQATVRQADATRLRLRLPEALPSWVLLHELAHALTSTAEGDRGRARAALHGPLPATARALPAPAGGQPAALLAGGADRGRPRGTAGVPRRSRPVSA